MPDLPPLRRLTYRLLGYLYWFTHWTSTHRLLGIRVSGWLKTSLLFLLLLIWARGWGQTAVLLLGILTSIVFFLYWVAKRNGYFHFVPGNASVMGHQSLQSLPFYKKVPARATGVFSVEQWEKHVLFSPGSYWQVPRGGHGVMVEHAPRRFLYQFFDAHCLRTLQQGWILYGKHPQPALAITFDSIWGPELAREEFSFFGRPRQEPEPLERTIYLSFADEVDEQAVWQNIVLDARHARSSMSSQGALFTGVADKNS